MKLSNINILKIILNIVHDIMFLIIGITVLFISRFFVYYGEEFTNYTRGTDLSFNILFITLIIWGCLKITLNMYEISKIIGEN